MRGSPNGLPGRLLPRAVRNAVLAVWIHIERPSPRGKQASHHVVLISCTRTAIQSDN